MFSRPLLAAAISLSLAAAPVAAQPPAPEPVEETRDDNGQGTVIFYSILPLLLLLTIAIGFAIGGDDGGTPASP